MKEFDRIVGYASIKKELIILADMMKNSEKYAKLGVKIPEGLILHGNPGVGKSLMAECLMKASGREYFTLRKNKPNGEFVNEIRETFQKAKEKSPSIVLLDDMDKFADEPYVNAEEFVLIQTCLDDVKEDDVFVVATVNDLKDLPDSLLREGRLGKKIRVNAPQGQDAIDIVQTFLSRKEFVAEVNAEDVAKMLNGCSCARLESVINEAGMYAAFNNKEKIEMEDIMQGILRVNFEAPKSKNELPEELQEAVAYHEAGHAVISETLEAGSTSLVSILPHNGDVQGITDYYRNENYWNDFNHMQNRVVALLGGKAATEIVYSKQDVGAASDVRKAFTIVERFVDDYCAFSFDSFERRDCDNELLNRKSMRITIEMEKYYNQAKSILVNNRKFLDAVAHALIERKTLVSSDIQQIKKELA